MGQSIKTYYHATSMDNLSSILENGLKASRGYGCVFMTEKEEESLRFVALQLIPKIVTLKVTIPEKDYDKIEETFDHSERFFKCRSFGYFGNIPPEFIEVSNIYSNSMVDNS